MHWYKMAQQLEFDFSGEYFLEDLKKVGFKSLGNGRFSIRVGNSFIQGEPDALITKLNFIIEQIRQDGIFLSNLVQSVADLEDELRARETMRLSDEEKKEYRDKILYMIRGLKKSSISDKNKIAVRDKIEDIALTFVKNPTWVKMKLQTVNKDLNNFANKIWGQVNALSKKRNLLVEGVRKGLLRRYQSYNLRGKTQGYSIEEQDQKGIYKVIKPNEKEYLVDMNRRKCNCPAGERGVPCKHLALIDQYKENN